MSNDALVTAPPDTIELPNGVILTGHGGDVEAMEEQAIARHEELHGKPTQVEEPAVETPKVAEPATEDAEPHLSRSQKRIKQLNEKANAAEQARLAAEARVRELEARVNTVPAVEAPKPVETAKPAGPAKPQLAQFDDYSDYIEALTDWKVEQRKESLVSELDARSYARSEAERASRSYTEHISSIFDKGRSAYSDFDQVLAGTAPILSQMHLQALAQAPNAEHVLYALANDSDGYDRFAKITDPVTLGLTIAQYIPRESVAPAASTRPVATSKAPAPPQPLGTSAKTSAATIEELADAGNFEAYQAMRRKQLGR